MRIKDVRASVHRLPIYLPGFDEPTEHRHHVFCEVETDEGHVGIGLTARFVTRAIIAFMLVAIAVPEIATWLPGLMRD